MADELHSQYLLGYAPPKKDGKVHEIEVRVAGKGLTPRARFHTFALAGVDPVFMLTGPIPATAKVLERAKMTLDQMDLVEIKEAFAPVVLAW